MGRAAYLYYFLYLILYLFHKQIITLFYTYKFTVYANSNTDLKKHQHKERKLIGQLCSLAALRLHLGLELSLHIFLYLRPSEPVRI